MTHPDRQATTATGNPGQLLPDQELLGYLRTLLPAARDGVPITLLERTANAYASSCPSEIVRVEVDGRATTSLFLKYETRDLPDAVHRRGVQYEAAVYREILDPLRATAPRFFGCIDLAGTGDCLVVEALTGSQPLKKAVPCRLPAAAAWIGRFHRQAQAWLDRQSTGFLRRYDRAQLLHWMDLAVQVATEHGTAQPWLLRLAERFKAMAAALLAGGCTVIHGEYYPMNILVSDWAIHPIDWESAGLGPGEIDLASLTMGWPRQVVAECNAAYADARFGGAAPADFGLRLDTARLYLCLRMLGNQRSGPGEVPFFDYLRDTAVACGIPVSASAEAGFGD